LNYGEGGIYQPHKTSKVFATSTIRSGLR